MTWAVGQTIYVVYDEDSRRFQAYENVITRVGRTKGYFVLFGRETGFYLENGAIDGGQYTSPGKVWQSREIYEEAKRIGVAWDYVRQRIPYRAPAAMGLDDVASLAVLLDIQLPANMATGNAT